MTLEVVATFKPEPGVTRVCMTDTNDYLKLNLVVWTFTHIKHQNQYQVGDKVEFTMKNLTHPEFV